MSYVIGRGRNARETYPTAQPSGGGAGSDIAPLAYEFWVGTPTVPKTPTGAIDAPFLTMTDALAVGNALPFGTPVIYQVVEGPDYTIEPAFALATDRDTYIIGHGNVALESFTVVGTGQNWRLSMHNIQGQVIALSGTGTLGAVISFDDGVQLGGGYPIPVVTHGVDATDWLGSAEFLIKNGYMNNPWFAPTDESAALFLETENAVVHFSNPEVNLPLGVTTYQRATNTKFGSVDVTVRDAAIHTNAAPDIGQTGCTWDGSCNWTGPAGSFIADGLSASWLVTGGVALQGAASLVRTELAIAIFYDDSIPPALGVDNVQQAIDALKALPPVLIGASSTGVVVVAGTPTLIGPFSVTSGRIPSCYAFSNDTTGGIGPGLPGPGMEIGYYFVYDSIGNYNLKIDNTHMLGDDRTVQYAIYETITPNLP